jgi:predicted RNase H-like nuclease
MKLAGIDLAWQGASNPSAIALGTLDGGKVVLENIIPAITGLSEMVDFIHGTDDLAGIAIDASLIINNRHGKRACEAD